ncbi:general stress protein [Aneurinibacillus sp. Ricciae_BoGa-3]|uniref:general stress protein n=1 Tax=Aneurinibacillus sp. Ricciae_BoGa-3 TaxID=3022697 RepID=UPI0023403377|nr:general stress protein [Aneurinibacillus sp. Ricciae_BoGa-3]WCK52471.1 general stress protein [Aneurinibacillus sp. Ricciae_BoGa-3]
MRVPQIFSRSYNDETKLLADVRKLKTNGYKAEDIYIVAGDDSKQDWLNLLGQTNNADWEEVGITDSLLNVFRSEQNATQNELEHLGISEEEARSYEKELRNGKYVLVIRDSTRDYHTPDIDNLPPLD